MMSLKNKNTPVIKLEGVSKSFGDLVVLDQLDLDIYPGQTLVILGESGTGKSVLLKHIIGLIAPDEGRILIDGRDIVQLDRMELVQVRTRFGMLFQGAALFDSLSVGENVAFVLREHTDMKQQTIHERVAHTLEMVGLPNTEDMMPAALSGGMKKRVGLARAIVMNPEFLLYDEPTTGLDPIMADVINELIIQTRDKLKATSVVVTHDIKSADKVGDRMVMLYNGCIIADDTPAEMRQSDNPIVEQFIAGRATGPATQRI